MAATHTTNLGLNKPDRQDFVSVVTDINDNMDMIDDAVGAVPSGHNLASDLGNPSSASDVTGSDAFSKIGTLNSKITLPSETQVSTLDAIKAHILSLHSGLSVGQTTQDYLNVTISYADGYFTKQTRYWGTYAKINSVQGAATYKSRQGDIVVVGVNNTSTTPVWNIDSVALNSKIEISQLDTPVDLNSYAAGTLYRFTTDGYLSVDSSSGGVIFRLYSYSNGRYIYNAIENQSISVFVKKGMQVDIRAKTGTPDIKFYPMTNT